VVVIYVRCAQPAMTLAVIRFDVDGDAIDLNHPVVTRRHLESQRESLVTGSGANIPRIADALILAGVWNLRWPEAKYPARGG
jgi:hypothetical protein